MYQPNGIYCPKPSLLAHTS
jgi:hypothetical protein